MFKSKALKDTTIDTIYPHHAKALQVAGIAPENFPTFKELENLRIQQTTEERDACKQIARDIYQEDVAECREFGTE